MVTTAIADSCISASSQPQPATAAGHRLSQVPKNWPHRLRHGIRTLPLGRLPGRASGEGVTIVAAHRIKEPQPRQYLTVADICDELHIPRSTFYDWRAKKNAPPCIKLPNGEIRVRRADFDTWLESWTERRS